MTGKSTRVEALSSPRWPVAHELGGQEQAMRRRRDLVVAPDRCLLAGQACGAAEVFARSATRYKAARIIPAILDHN